MVFWHKVKKESFIVLASKCCWCKSEQIEVNFHSISYRKYPKCPVQALPFPWTMRRRFWVIINIFFFLPNCTNASLVQFLNSHVINLAPHNVQDFSWDTSSSSKMGFYLLNFVKIGFVYLILNSFRVQTIAIDALFCMESVLDKEKIWQR